MPPDTFLVGYVDDIVALIVTRNLEDAQRSLNQVMWKSSSWFNMLAAYDPGPELWHHQAECECLDTQDMMSCYF